MRKKLLIILFILPKFVLSCVNTQTINTGQSEKPLVNKTPVLVLSIAPTIIPSPISSNPSISPGPVESAKIPIASPTAVPKITNIQIYSAGQYITDLLGTKPFYLSNLKKGATAKLIAITTFETQKVISNDIKWISSDNSIVTVDQNGMLNAIKAGNVIIKAVSSFFPEKKIEVNIRVYEPVVREFNIGLCQEAPVNVYLEPFRAYYDDDNPFASQYGSTPDFKERATFNGKVYDPNGITVYGSNVISKALCVQWVGEGEASINGAYVFRNAPVGIGVQITVTKEGWTTRTRNEALKSNLQGDPTANVFDFGGLGTTGNDATSSFYAIQDEPEITSVKINGKLATNFGGFPNNGNGATRNGRFGISNIAPTGAAQLRSSVDANGQPLLVSLTGVDNDKLDVELNFSEPVDRQSVEDNFKIISQEFDDKPGIEIDKNYSGITFSWNQDDSSVLIKTNKPLITTSNSEAKYLLKWLNPFKDKTDHQALKVSQGNISPTGNFRFQLGIPNDFLVFSVKSN